MTGHSARRWCAPALLPLALLAGCAIDKELRLERQGPGLAPGAAVAIETVPPENERSAQFAGALARAFAERGHDVAATAQVTAVFGFTQRARAIGTADGNPPASNASADIVWISAPTGKGAFEACAGERLRATLALYSRTDKALIYRASAETDGCAFTEADAEALAKALVESAAR